MVLDPWIGLMKFDVSRIRYVELDKADASHILLCSSACVERCINSVCTKCSRSEVSTIILSGRTCRNSKRASRDVLNVGSDPM